MQLMIHERCKQQGGYARGRELQDSFPFDQQFNILMRFIVDQTQTPNLKVKVAILKYIESLARQMDPTDFINSSETRLAVSRIITWTTEPKSSDVRKAAQIVLISLFELNTPEFTMLLGALPKTFQDGATKLLHNHLKNSSNTSVGSPSNTIGRTPSRHPSSRTSPLTSPTNCSHGGLSPRRGDHCINWPHHRHLRLQHSAPGGGSGDACRQGRDRAPCPRPYARPTAQGCSLPNLRSSALLSVVWPSVLPDIPS
ncbi:hypothetical protein J1605_019953 [Eschrichtius robustus]|uniref:CLIP-associating protein 1 n=1 Tax=Eschrichtius robustus TaxID=9764 RepID=A0AB34HMN9_ESCRO|nr:hypothetical protein J1605_019953 [Eschrichtius robustus]